VNDVTISGRDDDGNLVKQLLSHPEDCDMLWESWWKVSNCSISGGGSIFRR
jgi:hypothetical protein